MRQPEHQPRKSLGSNGGGCANRDHKFWNSDIGDGLERNGKIKDSDFQPLVFGDPKNKLNTILQTVKYPHTYSLQVFTFN